MSPARLLQYFDQISEATDAVPRLRRFILDLAVRGKLVEQDPADEPATELLKRIETEKRQLLTENDINRQEPLPVVAAGEMPFEVPSHWSVQRMGWLAKKLGAGSTPLGGKSVYQEEGVPFLRSQNVYDEGTRLEGVALISRSIHEEMSGTHVQPQDILLNITGASIGRCALVPSGFREGNVSQHVAIIRLFLPDIREFIHLSLISPPYQQLIRDVEVGVSREGLSMRRLRLFPMILPPIAEQSRIVAKVDELMALCDELETARAKRERRRDRLVAATLHGLNNGDTRPETGARLSFEESARFYFNHLPRLSTRPEHIHQLRQTILNLAVRGRLVPQLKEDAQLYAGEPLQETESKTPDRLAMCLPHKWKWVQVANVADARLGKMLDRNKNSGKPYRYLRNTNVHWFEIRLSELKVIRLEDSEVPEYSLRNGDVLICEGGHGIGRAAVWRLDEEQVVFQKALHRVRPRANLSSDFFATCIYVYFHSGVLQHYFTGVGIPHFTGRALSQLVFPLPPVAEQRRIVAKVDELMALCDELEARLATTASARGQVLEAALHEALEGRS